ncbi:M3 family oligoendopeptidase [bacterium]|nr:M3 family oligoendopeptidase [bacterium]
MTKNEKNWNLDDIITLEEYDAVLEQTRQDMVKFEEMFAKMSPDMSTADFLAYLDLSERVGRNISRLYGRASDMEAVDQKSSEAKALKEKSKDLYLLAGEASRKIGLWLKGKKLGDKPVLDDKNAARLFAAAGEREYSLQYMRDGERYSLEEREENIIAQKDANGVSVLTDLREMIETEQVYSFVPEGEKPRIIESSSELLAFVHDADPKNREAAYRALFEQQQKNLDKYFMVYQAVVKDWAGEAKLRGYKSSIAMRNRANHIPDEAIEALMAVCSDNVGLFQRFFHWKAGRLGQQKLRRFDIYAPLDQSKQTVEYSDAEKLVLEVFEEFSSVFAGHARRIIDARHIDSHPSPVKRGGAYCQTIAPDIVPYVMLNYTGKLRDVSTLAHELGHGVHSLYAEKLPGSVQHANLPLAETASTFGEMILFERLLERAESDEERTNLLADKLADSYATIIRQNYFVKFELMAHERIPQGMTAEELSDLWLETLKEQFGDAVEVDDAFRYEWSYIPHIVHTPFYCYAYNFGELLSLALYARYKKEGKSFIATVERILSAGGSQDPHELLKSVGIDMTDKQFWQGSFDIIREWVERLESKKS